MAREDFERLTNRAVYYAGLVASRIMKLGHAVVGGNHMINVVDGEAISEDQTRGKEAPTLRS